MAIDGSPVVGVLMGSNSDWDTMYHATKLLDRLQIPYETAIVSAHRTPRRLAQYAEQAAERGIKVIIAGAGGAAHLPGMLASEAPTIPILGVPVESRALKGLDSLYSIVQMPRGVPVATFSIGDAGAENAAICAAQILGISDLELKARLAKYRKELTDSVPMKPSSNPQPKS